MALPLASIRQTIVSPVTPFTGDTLLVEVEDYSRRTLPVYGTPHPDTAKWPNHKLCFIEPLDDDGNGAHREKMYRFTYCAEREAQEDYNFEIKQVDLGGITLSALVRTFFTPRTDIDLVTPAIGSTLAVRQPSTLWDTLNGTGDWLLADYVVERFKGSGLSTGNLVYDSLFVEETEVYVARITSLGRKYDSRLKGTFQTTRILYYRGEVVDGTPIQNLFANPSAGYWGMPRIGFFREGEQVDPDWFVVLERETISVDGTTGTGVGRDGIESSVAGAPYKVDSRSASISGSSAVGSLPGGVMVAVTSEEQEDGTWRNVVSYTSSASGNVAVQKSADNLGSVTSTTKAEAGSPNPASPSGKFVVRSSGEVIERGIDGSPAVSANKEDVVSVSFEETQQSVRSGETYGSSQTTVKIRQDDSRLPEPNASEFSLEVALRNVKGEAIAFLEKQQTFTGAAGEISSAFSTSEYGETTTTTKVILQDALPDIRNGDLNGGSARLVVRDVDGKPVLWEKQEERFIPTSNVTSQTKKCNGKIDVTTESRLVTGFNPLTKNGSLRLVRPSVSGKLPVYERTEEEMTVAENAGGAKLTNEYLGGVAEAEYTLSEGPQTLEGGFGIISGEVEPVSCDMSLKTVYRMEFGSLTAVSVDEDTQAEITTTKSVIQPGGGVSGAIIEPIDKWHSIQIVRSVTSPPVGFTRVPTRVNVSLPAEVTGAEFIAITASATGTPFGDFAADFGLNVNFKPGYSGGVPGYVTRIFQKDSPPTYGVPLPILRPAGASIYVGYSYSKSVIIGEGNGSATAVLREFSIPVSLHPTITLNTPTVSQAGATIYGGGTISGTEPTGLPTGGIYVVDSDIRPWKFGWWIGEFTEIQL